jgi:hypothetical protein
VKFTAIGHLLKLIHSPAQSRAGREFPVSKRGQRRYPYTQQGGDAAFWQTAASFKRRDSLRRPLRDNGLKRPGLAFSLF